MEEDVEVHAEIVQRGFDLGEHQFHARGAEDLLRVLGFQGVRVLGQDLVRDLGDVLPAVAVLRGGLPAGAGQQGTGEAVDLVAVVVEVVLPHDRGTLRIQDPGQGVTHGGPPRATQVDRTGGVRGDELEVDGRAGQGVRGPEGAPLFHDRLRELTGRGGVERDVEEARTGDVHRLHTGDGRQALGEDLRDVPGGTAHLLGHLHGHGGSPVPVLTVLGSLHLRVREFGAVHRGQFTGGHGVLQACGHGGGKFFRSHCASVTAREHPARSASIGAPARPGSIVELSSRASFSGPVTRHARVAQWIERLPPEQKVVGSNPVAGTR